MASARRLNEGWTLTDGVFGPFLIEEPMAVERALRAQGLLPAAPSASLAILSEEWAPRHAWQYETEFDAPDEDERVELYFEDLRGACEVEVNGESAAQSEGGALRADVTGLLREGKNQLRVYFARAFAPGGIAGPVWLRTGNYLTVREAGFALAEDGLRAEVDFDAHIAGKFVFKYLVYLGDEAVEDFEFVERLRATRQTVAHVLPLKSPAAWNPRAAEETTYGVRLSIERAGVGCALLRAKVARFAGPPRRVAATGDLPALLRNGEALRDLAELGAEAVAGEALCAAARAGEALDRGLRAVAWDDLPPMERLAETAMCRIETVEQMAAGACYWPDGAPVWKLTKSALAWNREEAEALFGANALGDPARAARLTRALQAERVRAAALNARAGGQSAALVCLADERPRYASEALVEYGGARRPAFYALQEAWAPLAVYAALPDGLFARAGEVIRLPIWLLCGEGENRAFTVTASCFGPDGALLSTVSFPAFAQGSVPAGALSVHLPGASCALTVRVTATDEAGGPIARSDSILCVFSEGDAPLGALLHPPRAALRVADGALVNEGGAAALAVSAGGRYGALLPGERLALSEAEAGFEALNA